MSDKKFLFDPENVSRETLATQILQSAGIPESVLKKYSSIFRERKEAGSAIDPADIAKSNEIYVYGPILSEDIRAFWADYYDDPTAVSSLSFKARLQDIEGDPLIRINSPGGDVWEMSAILQAMAEWSEENDKKFSAINDGLAASAASVVMCSCEKIRFASVSDTMIHRAQSVAVGNTLDFRRAADMLESTDETIADIYSKVINKSRDNILGMLTDETWLSAKEAVELGIGEIATADDKPDNSPNKVDGVFNRNLFFPHLLNEAS